MDTKRHNDARGFPGRIASVVTAAVLCAAIALLSGCTEDVYLGVRTENKPPTVSLTNGPLEGDTTLYQVHFFWLGYDPDGEVEYFEYALASGDPTGFDPADTTGLAKWTRTTRGDTMLSVPADSGDSTVTINENTYSWYSRTHTFFIRAVDDHGMRSVAAHRSFTAYTLAPTIFISEPYTTNPGADLQFLTPVIHFRWEGKDPLDSPWNYRDVDSVRYMHTRHRGDIIERLNSRPELYEDDWSSWIAYTAEGDSGRSTILGDDETMEPNHAYVFAVQAKDEAGAITSIFDARKNVRGFIVMEPTGPLLSVYEPFFGWSRFVGTDYPPVTEYIPANLPVNFSWEGDASQYGGAVSTYRYGWDVRDLSDPTEWDVTANPFHTAAPERKFSSGIHSFFIEAVDNVGTVTIARIEVNIVPLVMDRNLLWIDDFYSGEFPSSNYMMPSESQHDGFWIDICERAYRFDRDIDVYDTAEHFFHAPSIHTMWRYKNIIWTYCAARGDYNTWMHVMQRTSESIVGGSVSAVTYNILTYYLMSGGHLWTCGKADRQGGLAASVLYLKFPLYLKCEGRTYGSSAGCTDTSGVKYFPYRDYCASVLDKAYGVFRKDTGMPVRRIDYDAMTHAVVDTRDPVTLSQPDLPEALHLWDMVTLPGMFFDPQVRSFHYIEIYNPEYWMRQHNLRQRSCFHPLYRMKARSTRSAIDNAVIAFWVTTYADVDPEPPGTVAAPSVHFGMPLWFFDREEVRALADAIFERWNIGLDR
jgi:hypothetical protein